MSPGHAHTVRNPAERFYRLPLGYKRAGDVLAEQAEADRADTRNLLYPMLACYRLSIELYLKRLIVEHGTELEPKALRTHDLQALWNTFIPVLRVRGGGSNPD